MFIRKFLKPNQVDEVNAKGRFIKVMNCEGVFRIRLLSQGRALVDTDAAAGFDIQTSETFDFIEITSDIEQKLQLWASEHKLSYDALSAKPSRSSSFLVDHFGESQLLIGNDTAQSRVQIESDRAYWVGGEGVTDKSGIRVSAGGVYKHESAAPLYVYIDEKRTYKGVIENPKGEDSPFSKQSTINEKISENLYFQYGKNESEGGIVDIRTMDFKQVDRSAQSVFYYGGELYGVNNEQDGLLSLSKITFSEAGDDVHTLFNQVAVEATMDVRGGMFDGQYLHFYSVMNSGFDAAKIGRYNMSTGEVIINNYTIGDSKVIQGVFVDSVTGEHWVLCDTGCYVGDLFTGEFVMVSSSYGTGIPQFYKDYVVIHSANNSYQTAQIIKREGWAVLDTKGIIVSAHYTGDSWVYVDVDGVGQSFDDFNSKRVAYGFDTLGAVGATHSQFIEHESGLYCFLERESELRRVVIFPVVADLTEPKTQFKVFKESF